MLNGQGLTSIVVSYYLSAATMHCTNGLQHNSFFTVQMYLENILIFYCVN